MSYSYQWRRDNVDIGGATGPVYVFQAADVGHMIEVHVTDTGTGAAGDAEVGPIASSPPPPPSGTGNGMGSVQEGNYVFSAPLANLDAFMTDLNGTKAPADLPNTRCLLYRSVCSVNTGYDTSIPWSSASANGWLLKDGNGNLIFNKSFPANDIGDISNAAFSTALGNHVVALAKQYGFKGVWFDDTVAFGTSLVNVLPSGWTQAIWYANMVAHVGRVGAIVQAAGLECVFNANGFIPGDSNSDDGTNELSFWTALVGTGGPSGLTPEYWQESPVTDANVRTLGAAWYQHWDGWRRLHTFCNAHGVDFYPLSYFPGGSTELAYLRGSFLLDYTGGHSALLAVGSSAPTFKVMGAASGAAVEAPPGVWARGFANGTDTVNANTGVATIA